MFLRNLAKRVVATAVFGSIASVALAQPNVVVGGKKFTEQQLVAEMTAQLLRDKGYSVDKRADLGSSVLRAAQENGQVDVYWEYTGTSLVIYNGVKDRMDAASTYEKVKELDAQKGLTWLNPSQANNTYAFAMRKAEADKDDIASITDLANKVNAGENLKFASNAEFFSRPDGLRPLQDLYKFEFPRKNVVRMDGGLTYQALQDGQVNVALVLSTDGRIPAFGFVVLKDDKQFFPSYALTPVVRTKLLQESPELSGLLNGLSSKLDDKSIAVLNSRVDVGRESVESVAKEFLQKNGLIK
ncbi:glycine betaine ABC transporter substrate-binding protein [Pseudomonas sp. NPDC090592]|uniref:glycine betaine ABC transporter substrate-binding protein n=1 Tax=Pseudomonas sp. NPDC090592 TaxID=3364480 RepID=UPI003839DA72